MVDLMLIHDFMDGVYCGINGHQLVPLMPLGLVKTLGKGLRIHYMCIMVLELWCSEASVHLENGVDPTYSQVSLTHLCVKCVASFGFLHGLVMFLMRSWFVCRWMQRKSRVFIGCTINLGFLLHGHGKPTSKNHLPPLVFGHSWVENIYWVGVSCGTCLLCLQGLLCSLLWF